MTRYERRLAAARNGNEIEVLKTYKHEIEIQRTRKNSSTNGFIRQCCAQEIRTLTNERDRIERATVG